MIINSSRHNMLILKHFYRSVSTTITITIGELYSNTISENVIVAQTAANLILLVGAVVLKQLSMFDALEECN
jgi:hypothetical protein